MGCHGNHAFSHCPYQKIFEDNFVRIQEVPMKNLAPMKNCPGGASKVKSDAGVHILPLHIYIVYSVGEDACTVQDRFFSWIAID